MLIITYLAMNRQAKIDWNLRVWLAVAALLTLVGYSARAQSYSIDWYSIDGGGGTSTGGVYSVSGTIGQPDAGAPMSGGTYAVTGGFWSLLSVVPTIGAPLLKIQLTATNTALIIWPSASTGFSLQQNSDLSTALWTTPPQTVNDNGTNKFIVVSPPAGNRFYRLKNP